MKWTLEQLRTLVAVAETGSMTAAARDREYTVGAVSQQMQALADAAGTEVFLRSGRTVALTDAGLTLLHHARRILEAQRLAEMALSGPADARSLRVDLGVFGSAAVTAIPPATRMLAEVAPNILLRAREVDVEVMPLAVEQREIDLALGVAYPDSPRALPRSVERIELLWERFRIVLPPALASLRNTPEVLQAADAMGWILPATDRDFGRATRLACERAGIQPDVRHLVTDTAVSLAMVESGLGATLATPYMLRLYPSRLPTAELPGGGGRSIVAFVREGMLERESVATVLDILGNVLAGGTGPVPDPQPKPPAHPAAQPTT